MLVLGPSIAKAWDDLYYLERACEVQRLAQSSGRVCTGPAGDRRATAEQMRHAGGRTARLHLESIKRQLDRETPEYRQ